MESRFTMRVLESKHVRGKEAGKPSANTNLGYFQIRHSGLLHFYSDFINELSPWSADISDTK